MVLAKLFAYWVILHVVLSSAEILSKSTFSKHSFTNTIRLSNSLDPDQARRSVRPDLGPSCLQKLLADDTGRQIINSLLIFIRLYVYRFYKDI